MLVTQLDYPESIFLGPDEEFKEFQARYLDPPNLPHHLPKLIKSLMLDPEMF